MRRRKKIWRLINALASLLSLALLVYFTNTKTFSETNEVTEAPEPTDGSVRSIESPENLGEFVVKHVIDGDTVVLENDVVVRYIGIDAPEISFKTECFAKKSTEKNRELVEGKVVVLEKDISEKDRYGRLLRYVWINSTFINKIMVEEGYATVSTFPPNVKYQKQFIQSEVMAKELNKGLWAECSGE